MDLTPRSIFVEEADEQRAGERASDSIFFGPRGRYELHAQHTRFAILEWIVTDHETIDETAGLPAIIRQEPSVEQAVESVPGIWSIRKLNERAEKRS